MTPTVSVCIPTYNGAPYLTACLDSVLAQTSSDIEVLIVDDCSTDDTLRIANDLARRDSRIRVCANRHNLGLVGNWNHSVTLAHGEWIKFVFQDDLILPECIACMYTVARDTDVPIVSCARDFLFEAGTPTELQGEYLRHKARIHAAFAQSTHWSARDFCEAALKSLTIWNILGEPSAVLLHRSVFERFGWFNPQLRMLSDFEFWARIASNTGTVHIPEALATFRVHELSTSGYHRETEAGQYRFAVLDPLLILHDYAFHPLFAELRAVANTRHPPIDLIDEFWKRALGALWHANRAARKRVPRDTSLMEEWQVAVRGCPRLASIPFSVKLRSKWRTLRRTMTSSRKHQ